MNNLDKKYLNLLREIKEKGVKKGDRTGTGTKSIFGYQLTHDMQEGFPILTTKKMAWKQIITELLWFLRGETNIRPLVKQGNYIWVGDAYKRYCKEYWGLDFHNKIEYGNSFYNHDEDEYNFEVYTKEEFVNKIKTDDDFAEKWGDLGPVYGAQWRNWGGQTPLGEATSSLDTGVDQIAEAIQTLKTNPDSRRIIVSAWNPTDLPITDYRTDDELYNDYLKDIE